MYKINNKDFAILSKYKIFLNELDNLLENVPRKDMYYKDKIRDISITILRNILYVEYLKDVEEIKNVGYEIKRDISALDYMLDRLFDKKYISEKPLYAIGQKLIEVSKMVSSWVDNMVNSES